MKVSCCHCGKDIGSAVQKQMALYEVGKVVCPHCHKQNKDPRLSSLKDKEK